MRSMTRIYNLNDPGWGRDGNQNSGNQQQPPRRPDNQQTPPDLDEVWRDFNKRLSSMFGNKGGNQNPPPSGGRQPAKLPKGSPKLFLGLLILVIGFWLSTGFVIVQEGQVAVVTRFGQYTKTLNPGLQWRWPSPIEDHQNVNIAQLRTFEIGFRGNSRNKVLSESLMLTADESIVDVQFVVQYRLLQTGAPDYLFNTNNPDESVRQAAETAMREIVGKKPMDFVLYSGRTEVASEVQQLAQTILDRYKTGVQISTVAIQNVQPPEQVQAAFDDAVKAGQDRERQINEGNAYANKVLPEARGQVARMLQQAEGYKAKVIGDAKGDSARFNSVVAEYVKAPGVMRDRLYLSTFEEILANTSKVMVDSKNNNMLYLPLDQMAKQVAKDATSSAQPAHAAASAAASNTSSGATTTPRVPATTSIPNANDVGNLSNPYSPYSR
ncbi:FtsH protease activity modulator HflK [Paenalcaligenes sp.]|uniref:FtsH protease activity modulator HflK n=1 Tax=Paenalcaligenes sp. TaxID=1966342 RepID=UPI002604827E|nr:FtsH protease activity modulator HflK [Paenalcaligenes sp.]